MPTPCTLLSLSAMLFLFRQGQSVQAYHATGTFAGSSALDFYPYSSATCSILCLLGIQMQVRRVIKLSGHDHPQLSGHDPPPGTLRCFCWWSLDSLIYNMQRSKSSSLLHPPPRCTTRTGGRAYRLILTCTLGNPPIPDSFNPWFLFPLLPPTCRAR